MVETSTLIACLENYMFLAAHGEPELPRISYAGVRGHVGGLAMPLTNLVGATGPRVTVPERSIAEVFVEFARRSLPFAWLLGPHSPVGMSERLGRWGMTSFQQLTGLASSDLDIRPCQSPARIREARPSEQERFGDVLLDTFELDRKVVAFLGSHYFFAPTLRTRNYFAFVDGHADPVAVASSVYDPESPAVILAIAAVRERFRGRGVYRDLVRRRLADAKADGRAAAVVHAHAVSSRICRRLGFREICTQEFLCFGA